MNENVAFRRKHRTAPGRGPGFLALIFITLVAVLIYSMARLSTSSPPAIEPAAAAATESADDSITASRQNAIVKAANDVGPTVVSIGVTTTRIVRGRNPFYDDFFDSFFRDFLPPTYYKYREAIPNVGSGVIVSPDGYIITNQHVVDGAEKITVVTPSGLSLEGKLLGVHEASDIAVISVEAEELPYAPMGDSDDLLVGEWAIAIGNPFGNLIEDAQPSVTVGVVSAQRRSFKPDRGGRIYTEMIQTDAAINPGNSGGPLVNSDGEIIGINSFIFTRSGGSLGIGFAIPINRVKRIIDEVKKYGKVRDVWEQFTFNNINNEAARALGLPMGGTVVTSVMIGSPAHKAGLLPGDIITRVNSRIVKDRTDAYSAIYSVLVGDTLTVDVLRKKQDLRITFPAEETPQKS